MRHPRSFWLSIFTFICAVGARVVEQQVFDASPSSEQGLEVRRYLLENDHGMTGALRVAKEKNLDIWSIRWNRVDVRVPVDYPACLFHYDDGLEPPCTYTLLQPDLSTLQGPISSSPGPWDLSTLTNNTFHAAYHPLSEISEFLHQLAKDHLGNVELLHVGASSEGREMLGVKIHQRHKHGKIKPGFVIQGAQHAREWVATSSALYLAHALLVSHHDPHSKRHLLEQFDFHIIPVPNPDGYEYTWATDRFFYKNRQVVGRSHSGRCIGIDMNRNWGYKWLPQDAESDTCSHWYPGSRAFEAPEVNNIAAYINNRASHLWAFLDLRAYGQMLSSPFSYSCSVYPADAENHLEAGLGAAQAHQKVHGTHMSSGRLCEQLYSAPGNVVDWMYATAGIKYSYVAHLRDTGTYGFALPPKWIQPVGEETSALLEYLVKFVQKHHKL